MINKIKAYRALKAYTQQDLAERVGVSRQSIIAIESGKYAPSTPLALKIARTLDTTVDTLFELEGDD